MKEIKEQLENLGYDYAVAIATKCPCSFNTRIAFFVDLGIYCLPGVPIANVPSMSKKKNFLFITNSL